MTTTNNMVAKIAAAVAGLGLVFSAFAPIASAQSTTTQAQIDALLAQIAALQAQLGGSTSASASMTFTRDLTIGSTGADVTALQNWLISKGHTIAAGATGYFGAQTQAALASYQASVSISPAAGYFGPITRAHVNAQAGGSTDGDDDEDEDDEDEDEDDGDLEGGEADLSDFELNREESNGSEGEEEVQVATAEFDVEDGDIRIERMEITASSTNLSLEQNPWEYFDTLYVWADGEQILDMDVSDRDEWDEESDDDVYTLTVTGLDHVVREDERAEITFGFDIADNIDTADLAQDFEFYIDDEGIRGTDSEDIQQYTGENTEEVSFGFETEELGGLEIGSSDNDPDATTLISDEDEESDEFTVFIFELENEEDVDTIVTDITVDIDSAVDGDDMISDATLIIDDEEYDGDIEADGIVFEDIDHEIAADESVEAELVITLLAGADDTTVSFDIDTADVTAEDADTGDDITEDGSAGSETHTVAATGLMVSPSDDGDNNDADVNDDGTVGTFTIEFEVTALEDDLYVFNGAATASTTNAGVHYNIYEGGTATTTFFGTASDLLQSSAEESDDGDYYIVNEGDTETFTLTVTLDPTSTTRLYYVELEAVRFDETEDDLSTDDSTYTVPNEEEFETNAVSIEPS